jgi:hypothetical protein
VSEPLSDPVTVARIAKELFPGLVEIDSAQAALLAFTVLAKIKPKGDGKWYPSREAQG